MFRINGCRPGTFIFEHDGYLYYADYRLPSTYRCTVRHHGHIRCPGAAFVDHNNNVHVYIPHDHDHVADNTLRTRTLFQHELFRRCRETFNTFDEIYEEVSRQ